MRSRENIIYALIDPRDGEIRYIGKSRYGLGRAKVHRTLALAKKDDGSWKSQYHVDRWIRQLESDRVTFEIFVLESIIENDDAKKNLSDSERAWILFLRINGARLTNMTDGGDGIGMSGENHPMYGRHHSERAKMLIGLASSGPRYSRRGIPNPTLKMLRSRRTKCVDDGLVFSSAKEAALHYGVSNSYVAKVCHGDFKRPSRNFEYV